MSFKLSSSGNIYCSTQFGYAGRGLFDNKVIVGDYEIDIADFCALVEYVFTNTDLAECDPRRSTLQILKSLHEIEGYNAGNKRLGLGE
jgi:hypothetical protein